MDPLDILLPQHLADLRRSGLSDEQIARCGFRSCVDAKQIAEWLKRTQPSKSWGPCLVIPFFAPDGRPFDYVRVKPDKPRKKDGRIVKYEGPLKTPNRAYFPPATREKLADVSIPLLLTEGEKKSAKADQEGFACIGLVGVYGFQLARAKDANGKGQGERELIPDLATVAWQGRKVYIAFDSDIVEKPIEQWAEWHLAETLQRVGAEVFTMRIPPGEDGSKQGLDDYLVVASASGLRDLIAVAKPTERPITEPQPQDSEDDPHRLAGLFLKSLYYRGLPTLRFWKDKFVEWAGGAYTISPDGEMKLRLTKFIREEFKRLNLTEQQAGRDDGKRPITRQVRMPLAADVTNALRSDCLLSYSTEAPTWLDRAGRPHPETLISTQSGILDLGAYAAGKKDYLIPPTPNYFVFNTLPFAFDPKAPPPVHWLKFLQDIWSNDPDSIAAIQEWFGYLLTSDTRQQKILFLVGPRRAGKGTITRVLKEVVGASNVTGPTLNSLTTNFGLSPLLGKSVAIISDARFSKRSDEAIATERLLSISGEDLLTIDRKHLSHEATKLSTRIVIVSNELPRLADASGALAGRLIVLKLTRSFYNQEDTKLTDRLLTELPGILLWAIDGWIRLQKRGRFEQPATGAELIEAMEDLSSPVGTFVREECILDPAASVEVRVLYDAYSKSCQGREKPMSEQTFGRDLRAAVPSIAKSRPRSDGGRKWQYTGIRLRLPGDGHKCELTQDDANCKNSGPHGPHGPRTGILHAWDDQNEFKEYEENHVRGAIRKCADHVDHVDRRGPDKNTLFENFRDQLLPD